MAHVRHAASLGAPTNQDTCIHHLFEAQAKRTPDAVAVVYDGEKLTYQELNRRANQLAHYLRGQGVGPEVRVALSVDRSLEMIVALLGILKAGGAYVPLDPSYPRERLAFILEDTQAPVLLIQQHRLDDSWHHAHVVCLNGNEEAVRRESSDNLASEVTGRHLAYVIYTSGSTGRPKGVLVSHANVVRLFAATQPWFRFGARDVWTLFHSYAFDFSVWEIWGALLHGGRLVVVPGWISRAPDAFHDLLWQEQVTMLNQTPSAFRQLMGADEAIEAPRELSLRLVILGGEALAPGSLRPWVDRHGDQCPRLVNMYGITETTVHATYHALGRADCVPGARSVIGKPLPDLRVYLLDQERQPVPVGLPGEIYVGGAGVARGYLNRPELTAERFIPDPFSDEPGARLYRSGDRARYLPDGNLEFLGRLDAQVKIRG
jgi:amino acid adenylation domain-containing protein